jgi:uncharacterized protein (DUF427 family)
MLVFLKTSEEAACVPNETCAWTYTSTIPTVRNISTHWDETSKKWQVILNGTGWTGSADTTSLFVEGHKQKTVLQDNSLNYTIFEVTNINTYLLKNMKVYFDVGTPNDHDTVIDGTELMVTPKLMSVSV